MNSNNYLIKYNKLIFLILLIFIIFLFLEFFIIKNESWYHIESLMSFVNSNQNTKINFWEIIFKGTFFDDNPARFRPTSHIVEFIDNYLKLFLFNISIKNIIFNTLSNYIFILVKTLYCFCLNNCYLVICALNIHKRRFTTRCIIISHTLIFRQIILHCTIPHSIRFICLRRCRYNKIISGRTHITIQ